MALGGTAHLQSGATDRQSEVDVEPMTDSKLSTAGGREQRSDFYIVHDKHTSTPLKIRPLLGDLQIHKDKNTQTFIFKTIFIWKYNMEDIDTFHTSS